MTGRIRTLISGARTFCAAAMLERLWPAILMGRLRRPDFEEKPVSQLLSSTRRALIMAPHPDDELFGCPNLLLSLTRSGTKVTLAVVTDGSRQPADGLVSRLDMACNVARLNGWDFAHVGLCDGFGEHPDANMAGLLSGFLHSYLAENDGIDLIIVPLWSDYHADHQLTTAWVLQVISSLPDECRRPDVVLYWTFSAPIKVPEWVQAIRIDSSPWITTRQKWALEYGNTISRLAIRDNELIKAAVSQACWGQAAYETLFFAPGSFAIDAYSEAVGGGSICVRLDGNRNIIRNTVAYGLKSVISKLTNLKAE